MWICVGGAGEGIRGGAFSEGFCEAGCGSRIRAEGYNCSYGSSRSVAHSHSARHALRYHQQPCLAYTRVGTHYSGSATVFFPPLVSTPKCLSFLMMWRSSPTAPSTSSCLSSAFE